MESKPPIITLQSGEFDIFKFVTDNISSYFIGICNLDFKPIYVNKEGLKLVGLDSLESLEEKEVLEFFFPEDVDFLLNQFFPGVNKYGKNECDIRFRDFKTGEAIWMNYNVVLIKDNNGNPVGYSSICKNITSNKLIEHKLKDSEEQFRTLADNIPNLAWMANADGWIYWYNKKWYEYTGTTMEQMEGWGWKSVHDPMELPHVLDKWQASIASGMPFEMVFPLKGADGRFRPFLTRVLPLKNNEGEIYQWFGSNTDISKQKETEEALQESKDQLEFAIEVTELGTWDYNPFTNKFTANHRVKEWFGLGEDVQIELTTALNAILDTDRQGVSDAIQNALQFTSGGIYDIEYTIVHPVTKKETIVHAKGKARFNEQKIAYRFNGTLEDVTQQVKTRKVIVENEARFRNLIALTPVPMAVFNGPDHVIEMANDAMGERWKKKPEDFLKRKITDVFPEIKEQKFLALLDQVYKTGEHYRENESVSYIRYKDGIKTFYLDFEYAPLLETTGEVSGIIVTVNDVTEKVLARKRIEESEKRYHQLIYSSPSAIGILHGEEMVITIANEAIIEIWGKGKAVIGKGYFEVLPELADQGYKEIFAEVYRSGNPFNSIETPVHILQGGVMTLRYYNFLLYPQRNFNGEVDGIGIIATEVTSQALLNKQIQESEKKFRLLADSMPQHIWTSDLEGNLNYYNQSVFDYSGLTLEQINKDGWLQIVHPEDREENIREWMKSIKSGEDFLLEHRFRKYDGTYRWQLSRAVAQKDENGMIQMWVGTSTDIQEQKKFAEELEKQVKERTRELRNLNESLIKSEERYHLMVGEVQDYAIIYLDKDGIVENWNAGAEKIKGYKAEEIIGKSFYNFYTAEDRKNKLPQLLLEKAVKTGRAVQEGWRVRKGGTLFWASVVITAIHNKKKEVIGFSKVTHDLTDKKAADDRIKRNASELEQKNADLENMNKELQSFAYISSHDLQEPLRKIQTFSSRILEKELQNLSDTGKDHFRRMQNSAMRMQELIDDLLAYSRTNTTERKFEKTNINTIVEEVRSDLYEELLQKQATIEVTGLGEMNVIPFQFRQLLHNLISNAIKFSKAGEPLHLKIKSYVGKGTEFGNDKLLGQLNYNHIRISDNGIGFEQKYSNKIFELFHRLHNKTEYIGTGIGLAIAKKIVENHGGEIVATGELNAGATFDIFIPVMN